MSSAPTIRRILDFHNCHKALTVRRGYKRALVAIAHKLAQCVFAVLRDRTPCRDPETDYEAALVRRNAPRWLRQLQAFDILVRHDDGATPSTRPPATLAATLPVASGRLASRNLPNFTASHGLVRAGDRTREVYRFMSAHQAHFRIATMAPALLR